MVLAGEAGGLASSFEPEPDRDERDDAGDQHERGQPDGVRAKPGVLNRSITGEG